VFSVLFVAAVFWPVLYGGGFVKQNKMLVGTWAISCLTMSTFTLLPALKIEDVNLM
jgi:phosphatidylinositol glycan class N